MYQQHYFSSRNKQSPKFQQMIGFNSIIKYIIKVLMIQKNSLTNQEKIIIDLICQQSLGFFVQKSPLTKSNFPLLQTTYTIWRIYAYEKSKKQIQKFKGSFDQRHVAIFFQNSQTKYLPKFIQRIESEMNLYSRGLQDIQLGLKQYQQIPKQQQQIYDVIIQLGKLVWSQQLYVQLIQDLINLPYLQVMSGKSITPRQEYTTGYIFQKKSKSKAFQIANKAGKNIFDKVLSSLTNTVLSKAFVFKINTLFGTFNPLLLGASIGLSHYLKQADRKKKEENIHFQIKSSVQYTSKKLTSLKQIYAKCKKIIQQAVRQGLKQASPSLDESKKKLKQLFLKVFEEQWLHIQVSQNESGWQVIKIQEKQSFEQLIQ